MIVHHLLWRIAAAALVSAVLAGCGGKDEAGTSDNPADVSPSSVTVANPDAAPATATAPTGIAPMPRMLAIDRGAILRNSAAGKSIVAQAEQLQNASRGEFKAEADRLQADAGAYRQQQAILAPAVRQQKERELRSRQTALEQRMQARGGQIQGGINKAILEIEKQLGPVLQQIMTERKADIIVDRAAIVMAAPSKGPDLDITPLAIQRLDRVLPRVPVALAPPQAAQRPAPGH